LASLEEKCVHHLVRSFLDVLVLSILSRGPLHGYGIIADIHRNFGVLLSPGTLYPLLYSLEKELLIDVEKVERRKVYHLTGVGRRRLSQVIKLYRKHIERMLLLVENKTFMNDRK